LFWNTHDQKQVKTHGLVFETRIGSGRLLVSALRHSGEQNVAGQWLLSQLVTDLWSSESPRHALPADVWAYLKANLQAEQTNLVSCTWRFQPDPQNEGLARGWEKPALASDADWQDIHIGAYWESQGYSNLDCWAWYRLWVDIPEDWKSKEVFLWFEGVDDMCEVYVNGTLAGKGGDLATRRDALSERKGHNITWLVKPGQEALIAVPVDAWQRGRRHLPPSDARHSPLQCHVRLPKLLYLVLRALSPLTYFQTGYWPNLKTALCPFLRQYWFAAPLSIPSPPASSTGVTPVQLRRYTGEVPMWSGPHGNLTGVPPGRHRSVAATGLGVAPGRGPGQRGSGGASRQE
jgi:hypothetical protein